LDVTDSAREELQRILGTHSLESGRGFRLATPPTWEGEGDFGIVIDVEKDGDEMVEQDGARLLMVDQALSERLSSAVMDFKDFPPAGPRFTLDVY
jgi:Fe-S cluster assembly iron-binding protein IscA